VTSTSSASGAFSEGGFPRTESRPFRDVAWSLFRRSNVSIGSGPDLDHEMSPPATEGWCSYPLRIVFPCDNLGPFHALSLEDFTHKDVPERHTAAPVQGVFPHKKEWSTSVFPPFPGRRFSSANPATTSMGKRRDGIFSSSAPF